MKKYLVGLVLVASTSVFAAPASETKTTDMYAPKAGGAEFLAGIIIPTGKYENSGTSVTVSGISLKLEYGYAFNDFATLYVTQGYSAIEYSTSPGSSKQKFNGIGDTKVGVKAVVDFGQTFLYYDVGYEMGLLAKAKTNSSNESTAVSARPFVEAQIGGGGNFDMIGLGGLLKFDFYQDGDSDVDVAGTTVTTKNKSGSGMSWKIYAQYQSTFTLGLSYGEMKVDSYDSTTAGVTSSNAKLELKQIAVYSIIPINATSEVFIELQKPEDKNLSGTQSFYNVLASYRATF